MRLYLKLAILILITVAVHRALPSAMEVSQEASFALRCGIAKWSGNGPLEEQLIDEARQRQVMQMRRVAAGR